MISTGLQFSGPATLCRHFRWNRFGSEGYPGQGLSPYRVCGILTSFAQKTDRACRFFSSWHIDITHTHLRRGLPGHTQTINFWEHSGFKRKRSKRWNLHTPISRILHPIYQDPENWTRYLSLVELQNRYFQSREREALAPKDSSTTENYEATLESPYKDQYFGETILEVSSTIFFFYSDFLFYDRPLLEIPQAIGCHWWIVSYQFAKILK